MWLQVMNAKGAWQNIELQSDDVAVLVGRVAEAASAGVLTAAPTRVVCCPYQLQCARQCSERSWPDTFLGTYSWICMHLCTVKSLSDRAVRVGHVAEAASAGVLTAAPTRVLCLAELLVACAAEQGLSMLSCMTQPWSCSSYAWSCPTVWEKQPLALC